MVKSNQVKYYPKKTPKINNVEMLYCTQEENW